MFDTFRRWVTGKVIGVPADWLTTEHMDEFFRWQLEHEDPDSGVWAVTAPCGEGWKLWPPGSPTGGPYPYKQVEPFAVSMHGTTEDGGYLDGFLFLADTADWLKSWIGETTGGQVVEMIGGISRFGPQGVHSEYAVYVRVQG